MSEKTRAMKDALKKEYSDWYKDYESIAAESFNAKIKTLAPGERIPDKGMIHGKEFQDQFRSVSGKHLDNAKGIIANVAKDVYATMNKAPSQEAVNAISMFALRAPAGKIESQDQREQYADEIDHMMCAYSDYQSYTTLRSFAEKAGIHNFKKHSLTDDINACAGAEKLSERLFDPSTIIYHGPGAVRSVDTVNGLIDGAGESIFGD